MMRVDLALVLAGCCMWLCCQVEGHWLDGAIDAKSILEGGVEVRQKLETKIREKRSARRTNAYLFGLNLDACADLSDEYGEAETLLASGATLYGDASGDYHDITDCFSSPSMHECWTQVVEKLPNFLEKYKPLTACYINNVYYVTGMLDYYFDLCVGGNPEEPQAPPKTYEQCLELYQ